MKRFFIALCLALCLLVASPTWAAVTYDTSTGRSNPANDTADSFSHVIGTGTNVYVAVCVSTRGASAVDVTDVDIGGVQGTPRAVVTTGGFQLEVWDAVLGSTNGSVTVAVTTAANDVFYSIASSFFGVNQSSPVGGDIEQVSVTSTSITADVTSAVGNIVYSCLETNSTADSLNAGTNQDMRHENEADLNNTHEQVSTEPGGSTITMSHSWTNSTTGQMLAFDIQAATASTRRPVAPLVFQ